MRWNWRSVTWYWANPKQSSVDLYRRRYATAVINTKNIDPYGMNIVHLEEASDNVNEYELRKRSR